MFPSKFRFGLPMFTRRQDPVAGESDPPRPNTPRPGFWLPWVVAAFAAMLVSVVVSIPAWTQPITLLLLGADGREPGTPARSDSIFVLHADPVANTVRGLSLPRDLYAPLSGLPVRRTARINAALFYGDYYATSKGIPAARETISRLIGVPIDHTVVVNFDFVRKLVDEIGGVEVYCSKPIVDNGFYPLRKGKRYSLRFESGWNFLNGKRALDFIRLRRPDTDFGRMGRNQQFLCALGARIRSVSGLIRLPRVLPAFLRGVRTDLGPIGSMQVAWTLVRCPMSNIEWNTIEKSDVLPLVTPDGAQVLVAEPGVLEEAGKTLIGKRALNVADVPGSLDAQFARP
jgi:polyisoprenyl-teichoic acid--peptidoglycan teichoic acid transferase